ncbi:hypothetical protein HanRHA438_Chr12g0563711 [Helianthus annuus]|nr:hypothetical protein HanRHA438_Chr12g0563711 [Helianthus annuus]
MQELKSQLNEREAEEQSNNYIALFQLVIVISCVAWCVGQMHTISFFFICK